MLEKKIKETHTSDDPVHKVIEGIKQETDAVYKEALKGELKEMSNVDRQQWRRKKYLEMLYNNLGQEEVDGIRIVGPNCNINTLEIFNI